MGSVSALPSHCRTARGPTCSVTAGLGNRVIVVDLHFHATLWGELGDDDCVNDLAEVCRVGLSAQAIIKCMQICCSNNVGQVCGLREGARQEEQTYTNTGPYIARVENKWIWSTLRAAPEWLTCACHSILGKTEQKLTDFVVVISFKLKTGPGDAFVESERLVGYQE